MRRTPENLDNHSVSSTTLASTVYARLRQDLFNGLLEEGCKLRIDWMVERYASGASPVREALNRLAAEGLINRHDQRGFAVKRWNVEELAELTRTRCWLEERGLRESIANRTLRWDENLVLALHRLTRVSQLVAASPPYRDPEWDKAHSTFHRTLISGCKSDWLIVFCGQISDQLDRYRVLERAVDDPRRDCIAEHRKIAEAALDGDADLAAGALVEHILLSSAACESGLRGIIASDPDQLMRGRLANGVTVF